MLLCKKNKNYIFVIHDKIIYENIMNNTINIVYITDNNYSLPTCVSINSLKMHRNKQLKYYIYVLCNHVDKIYTKVMCSLSDLNFSVICLDYNHNDIIVKNNTHVSSVALIKFKISYLFDHLNKILYLDSDTLIYDDLYSLYNTNLDEYYLGAVADIRAKDWPDIDYKKRLSIDNDNYFNSGIMLLNIDEFNKDNISDKLLQYRLNNDTQFMDQDALNVICGHKCKYLSFYYNCLSTTFRYYKLDEIKKFYKDDDFSNYEKKYKIYHFASGKKPWKHNVMYSEIWQKYYEPVGCSFSKFKNFF